MKMVAARAGLPEFGDGRPPQAIFAAGFRKSRHRFSDKNPASAKDSAI
jgi:hypothetical protein